MTIPHLTEASFRKRVSDTIWQRGLRYYNSNSVEDIVWRDGVLLAAVQGSNYAPYTVRIQFEGERLVSADCTCPYDYGGDCKHIAATLICAARSADKIAQLPATHELLASLSREQLITLINDLINSNPAVGDQIDRLLPRLLSTTETGATNQQQSASFDATLLSRQIKADIRGAINYGYDGWGEEAFYDSDFSDALSPACDLIRSHLATDNFDGALSICETAIKAWDDGVDSLDEYVQETFEEWASEWLGELTDLWSETLLRADLSRSARDAWAKKLGRWANSVYGGNALDMVVSAAEDGWDAPALVAAMQGNITEKGAWAGEPPDYADELTLVRLRILEQRGQFVEYLNLAQAEGQYLLYLHMLIKQGRSAEVLAHAVEHLNRVDDIQLLCKTLVEVGEVAQAFELAQHGLTLTTSPYSNEKATLAAWLRELARTNKRPELAQAAARTALAEDVTLDNYLAMQREAGNAWDKVKSEALTLVARGDSAENKVDIYLHEKMFKEAIVVVNNAHWFSNLHRVIDAVQVQYPDWAFQQCRKQADGIMDAGRSKDYDVAAEWLRRGKEILREAGKSAEFDSYLETVMEKHHRKYSLMPKLQGLR